MTEDKSEYRTTGVTRVEILDNMDSIQEIIGEFNDQTFGTEPGRSLALAYHLFEEAAELLGSLGGSFFTAQDIIRRVSLRPKSGVVPDELADVGVLLLALAHTEGLSLREEVLQKHEVNKARQWPKRPNENGVFRHQKVEKENNHV
ncbi:MAG: hypothetical protein A2Z21_09340 [Candidatus Fraserbacteria bacterium RBG_16_55_9]|uniref:dATP/dGTP diphosphohydrolase MazZ domain-containing protein n=1 Tax=Fraserbacteria sp. (strain RBG_16_55_9) TaxID=1817864 RepID=A0A1F5US07_FRAXR|nr:MAG: hypothetical protein A2Z21_09340 [Candidatus Fraserbacteria bacterium RBG_16_55_9]